MLALTLLLAQAGILVLGTLPPVPAASRGTKPHGEMAAGPLFLSVHVPIHHEPPEIVVATLAALAAQDSPPPHEVIVLDNNTADPACWRPVAAWCRTQGARFRFLHRMRVVGAKAGALNIALDLADPRTTHVVVIDADYQVAPDFLNTVETELHRGGDALLQFPQSYRGASIRDHGVALELGEFFLRHATAAGQARAMLPTGTLCVIARPALEAAGRWSARTKTEDAELGVRLLQAGFRGRFVPRIGGRGLMPLDYAALRSQRRRWVGGNVRTLWLMATDGARPMPLATRLMVWRQLTAWVNLGFPAAATLCLAALAATVLQDPAVSVAIWLSAACIALVVVWQAVALWIAGRRTGASMSARLTAIATRIALMPAASLETVCALLPRPQAFAVTPKRAGAGCENRPGLVDVSLLGAGVGPFLLAFGPLGAIAIPLSFCVFWLASSATAGALQSYTATVAALPDPHRQAEPRR